MGVVGWALGVGEHGEGAGRGPPWAWEAWEAPVGVAGVAWLPVPAQMQDVKAPSCEMLGGTRAARCGGDGQVQRVAPHV